MRRYLGAWSWLLALALLAGCAGELNTPGEALRLLGGSLEDAYLGEPYESSFRPAGGLRPYEFELGEGELPPGLTLTDGVLRGTPTELGNFTFTIILTDANLSSTFLEHRLRVLELPDPLIEADMPETEVRAPFTVRVSVSEARELQGLSTRLRWDPEQFSYVEGSLDQNGDGFVLFAESGTDWLQVDLAWSGSTYTGERLLFTFQLEPAEPARPGLAVRTLFASGSTRNETFQEATFGARVPPVAPPTPEPETGHNAPQDPGVETGQALEPAEPSAEPEQPVAPPAPETEEGQ